jgi:hypothetical protein
MRGLLMNFRELYDKAHAAGMAAGAACKPVAMVVGHAASPLGGGIDYSKPVYHVPDGPCGFAWVTVKPGNCRLANWLKKAGLARKAYGGGVAVWVSEFGQSMARKEAYARAFAKVLNTAGFSRVYAESRMD